MNDKQEESIRIIEAIGTTTIKQTRMKTEKEIKGMLTKAVETQKEFPGYYPDFDYIRGIIACLEWIIGDKKELITKAMIKEAKEFKEFVEDDEDDPLI